MVKKTIACILAVFHLVVCSPIRDALAFQAQSASFTLQPCVLSVGGGVREAALSRMDQDVLAEPVVGKVTGASMTLNAGYAAMLTYRPPVQSQVIPNFSWSCNESLSTAFDLDDYFLSPDSLVLSYTAIGFEEIDVAIDPVTHAVSLSQPAEWSGTEQVRFTAWDSSSNFLVSNDVTLQVLGQANAPVMDHIPDVTVSENELVSITPSATDLDGDAITFSFSAPFDEEGSWQTDYNDAGSYIVIVTVTDATGLSVSQDVGINVSNVNRPPVLQAIPETTVTEGQKVVVSPIASDPDADALTFYYSAPLATDGTWLTGSGSAGTYEATVTVSDGIDTTPGTAVIHVLEGNAAPEATMTLSAYTLAPQESVTVTLEASDPDGHPMTFVIKKDDVTIASGDYGSVYSLQTSFENAGDHNISAVVTDSLGLETVMMAGVDVVDPNIGHNLIRPISGDFNGDALVDLGQLNTADGTWEVCLSDKGVFHSASDWTTGFGTTSQDERYLTGDYDGDAKADAAVYSVATGELRVAKSTGSGFGSPQVWFDFAEASGAWSPSIGNFNADRYADLALYNENTGEVRVALGSATGLGADQVWATGMATGYKPYSGDFNGDGLTDLCLFLKASGSFKVAASNGRVFVDTGDWISGFANNQEPVLCDTNRDGMTDVMYWSKPAQTCVHAVSTGEGFAQKGQWLGYYGTPDDEFVSAADLNGDGAADLLAFNFQENGIDRWSTLLTIAQPVDLMDRVDNGIGGYTEVDYTYAAAQDNPELPFPVTVASAIRVVDTLPVGQPQETYEQSFSFSEGYYDSAAREFRGFGRVQVTDPVTGNYSQTEYYQGRPEEDGALKGQVKKLTAYDGNERKISETINTYEVRKSGPETNVLGFPMFVQTETTVWEENETSLSVRQAMSYDNIGNVIQVMAEGDVSVAGDERTTRAQYAPAYTEGFNRPIETTLEDDQANVVTRTEYAYDERGNLTQETVWGTHPFQTGSEPVTVSHVYDSFGNNIVTYDPFERAITTEYETTFYTYPERITNALGHSVSYVYDPRFGAVVSATDPNDRTSTTAYDSLGRVTEVRNAFDRVVTSYVYPDFNTVTKTQLGLSATQYVDGLGRKYRSVASGEDGQDARDVVTEAFYNARGLVESEAGAHYAGTAPSEITYVRYGYDLRGRVTETTQDFPGSLHDATSHISYLEPLYAETMDPMGHRKGARKDVRGNVVQVKEFGPGGVNATAYEYDIQDNLVKLTDDQGNVAQMWYDTLGRKVKMDDPDMGVWEYEYDNVGNLIEQRDAKGQTFDFVYDDLNRLTAKEGSGIAVAYTYDDPARANSKGRLSRVTDASGTTDFFYDELGREIKSIKTVDGVAHMVERAYDDLDRLTALTYPDGAVVEYGYDPHSGFLESVAAQGGVSYASGLTYNAQGQMKHISFGNGTATDYSYGQDTRLSRIFSQGHGGPLQDLNYLFDHNGNITTLTDNLRSNIRTFTYDSLDRLTRAENVPSPSGGYATFTYMYDSIGNMTYKSDVGVMGYGVAAGPHAVTSAGGYAYQYDANGNRVSGKNKTFTYDAENRIMGVTTAGSTTAFVYDGDGGRVKKTTTAGSGTAETLYIGSLFEITTDSATPGSEVTIRHVFAGSQRICSVRTDAATQESTLRYIHSDHLGSANAVTDEAGLQAAHYEYTPYGTLARNEGTDLVRHKFTGKELDETGFYFYSARYYDPVLGSFLTADTLVQSPYDPQSLNRYSYCRNNPLNLVDPTGHWFWFVVIGAIIGAASSAATGGDIGLGALTGALGGALFAGAGMITAGWEVGFATASVYAGAGALSGAASAGITGGNAGIGALIGGLGGAIGYGVGTWAGDNLLLGFLGSAAAGAAVGGLSSSILGGEFGEGAWRGAASAGISCAVSTIARSMDRKSPTEAEKQEQQRKISNLQETLDKAYAEGGTRAQLSKSAEIAARVDPQTKTVISRMIETWTAEYWIPDYIFGDPTQFHVRFIDENKTYNYVQVPTPYVLLNKSTGPNIRVRTDFRILILYQDYKRVTEYNWGPLDISENP